MGRTVELGREPSVDWASWESGEDPGAVGELLMLHGIQVVLLPLRIGGRLLALVRCDCRV